MNTHEYQAKTLLQKYGIPTPPFEVVSSREEAEAALLKLGIEEGVVKVQVHAGGRGKAGGVKLGKILPLVDEMLGMRIQNQQTGAKGVIANQLLITPAVDIAKEYYLAAVIDRERAEPILMASKEGGMEIEENPDRIVKVSFDEVEKLVALMEWDDQGREIAQNLAKAFLECDGSLLEINPLVLTKEGELLAVDAKFSIDDNALFRHPDIAKWYDPTQSTEGEVMAKEYDLAYIGLEGEIGCLVNGAGLAMATMDIIHFYGGKPANFLDVGGGATKEQVAHGFKIILSDPSVKSIFVNIFGGIMDCGVLAEGIVAASKEGVHVPLVVRMEGTNVEIGKKILKESGLDIITADTMADGAIKAVKWQS
ncbi:MAG: Succinate--CoA ligase [ADP-forming] subunit beta [Chlamydiales bacterium]|nr:Succinate--CoA ligase [ADP-forming] subunit beta [Chlamydiales bacterium]MCH9620550.1 Succinate--CoA ligase [ADP-forming] subunit beta [Chlamydiales bacterium]MCH9623002.1 Succinate--CoA ligase [ADP-forming] subunit beta [Chlamydiales bacterium]